MCQSVSGTAGHVHDHRMTDNSIPNVFLSGKTSDNLLLKGCSQKQRTPFVKSYLWHYGTCYVSTFEVCQDKVALEQKCVSTGVIGTDPLQIQKINKIYAKKKKSRRGFRALKCLIAQKVMYQNYCKFSMTVLKLNF